MTIVRKIQKADSEEWARMRSRLWDSLPISEHMNDINKMLTGSKRFGYIAIVDPQKAAGFAEVCIRDYANGCTAQPVPFLEGIWVERQHRRQGIGGALLVHIVSDLADRGFHEICSDADIRNRRSHLAHNKWGFTETERVVYFRRPFA